MSNHQEANSNEMDKVMKLSKLITFTTTLIMATNSYSSSYTNPTFSQVNLDNTIKSTSVNQNLRSTITLDRLLNPKKAPLTPVKKLTPSTNSKKFQDLLNDPQYKKKGGFSSGGGGNSVVCFNGSGEATEIELLDYYEGIRRDNSAVKGIGMPGDSVEEKIVNAFSTLENEYPRLSVKLKNRALWLHENIQAHLIESTDGQLSPVYDMNIPFVPQYNEAGDECMIVRFAVQYREHVEGQKKFYFVKELYESELTDDDTRAGIIIHEIIYEEAIKNGAINSDFVRWLTYIIGSKKIGQMSQNEIAGLEYQPGGEFLGNLGVDANPRRTLSYDFTDLKSRDRVYALNIYDIPTAMGAVSCYDLGLCQLFDGEFLGRKRNSSAFLPKFNVMLRKNTIIRSSGSEALETKRGENLVLSNDNIANRKDNLCVKNGACIGDIVGVTKETSKVFLSYSGVVVGIFGDKNYAVQVIDGRFDVYDQSMNPNVLYNNNKEVILYVSKGDISFKNLALIELNKSI